ncbi:hypothetical protein LCGC14_2790630, partial [marine sediment metagenome]
SQNILTRGAKIYLEQTAKLKEQEYLTHDQLKNMFEPEAYQEMMKLFLGRLEGVNLVELLKWWSDKLLPSKQKAAQYPLSVASKKGPEMLSKPPKLFIGTGHSFKGAEADCSPGDELVLTKNRGYVRIDQLNPRIDKLISFNSQHHKIHRGGPRRPLGYSFKKGSRYYEGELLTVKTANSCTRITPNHQLTIRWNMEAIKATVVYLMRRGNWWRIGITKLQRSWKGSRIASGVTTRMNQEQADEGWILGMFKDRIEAQFYEKLWSNLYGVPELPFEQQSRSNTQMNSQALHKIWNQLNSKTNAKKLLEEFHLNSNYPLWKPKEPNKYRRRQTSIRNRWLIRAANLIPGFMEIPTDPGSGQDPQWLTFTIERHCFKGTVYSLDVERWHHYISGNAVVHNCVIIYPDLSPTGYRQ